MVITKRIAGLMGGEVGVDSAPGRGSTFWLTVRLSKARAASADTESDPAATAGAAAAQLRRDHRGARILLAEDDKLNQEVALELLREAGLDPDLAQDGRAAARMSAQVEYALILMDVQMPEIGGLDATRAIRALPGRATTPVVAMTPRVFDEDRRACLAAGMDDFIGKPLEPEQFFTTLLRWLGRRR